MLAYTGVAMRYIQRRTALDDFAPATDRMAASQIPTANKLAVSALAGAVPRNPATEAAAVTRNRQAPKAPPCQVLDFGTTKATTALHGSILQVNSGDLDDATALTEASPARETFGWRSNILNEETVKLLTEKIQRSHALSQQHSEVPLLR